MYFSSAFLVSGWWLLLELWQLTYVLIKGNRWRRIPIVYSLDELHKRNLTHAFQLCLIVLAIVAAKSRCKEIKVCIRVWRLCEINTHIWGLRDDAKLADERVIGPCQGVLVREAGALRLTPELQLSVNEGFDG
jgi:hypothetical protein